MPGNRYKKLKYLTVQSFAYLLIKKLQRGLFSDKEFLDCNLLLKSASNVAIQTNTKRMRHLLKCYYQVKNFKVTSGESQLLSYGYKNNPLANKLNTF